MRKYLSIIFLVGLLVVMSSSSTISLYSKEVMTTFSYILLPSLAPAILLDYLFINVGGLESVYRFLKKHTKNPHTIYRHLIVILGIVSGTPSLANYINDSVNKGYLSLKEGQVIMNAFLLPSFPFIIGIIIPHLSLTYGIILIILLYIPSIIYYLLSLKGVTLETEPRFEIPKATFLKDAIDNTASTLILLLGTILLFSLPMPFIKLFFNDTLSYYILGFFEFTSSSLYIINCININSFIILIAILSFSSLSLYVQTSLLCPKVKIKEIIKKRSLFLGINLTIILLMSLFKIL